MQPKYFVYVIKSDKDKTYIGQTNDLEKRLRRHNNLLPTKKSSFTSHKGTWRYVYLESYGSRDLAIKREKYFKTGKGREFLKLKISSLPSLTKQFA